MFFASNIRAGCLGLLGLSLLTDGVLGAPLQLSSRTMSLPPNTNEPLLVDIDGDGRSDLLVLNPVEKKLLRYNQGANGFGTAPDQSISLPPNTAWLAPCDVVPDPGLEILFSTAAGFVYSGGSAGQFDSELRTLINVSQQFPNVELPTLTQISTNQTRTNLLIPVISDGRPILYQRNDAYEWAPSALPLEINRTTWNSNNAWPHWSAGGNSGKVKP